VTRRRKIQTLVGSEEPARADTLVYWALARGGALMLEGGVPFLYADEEEVRELAEEVGEGAKPVRVRVLVEP